jgi:ankyrin repeat protein
MALAKAVADNDLDAVKSALKGGGKQELNAYGPSGELLLHVAIRAKNHAVAGALLQAGANVNQECDERGTTKGYTAAHFAARAGDVDALNLLQKYGCDVNRAAADGWTPIHCACFAGKSAATKKLVELGANVNAANEHGMIPLVFAANHGRVSDVRFLIKNGADVHFTDSNGDSLMHHALHFRLQEMFEGAYDMPECQYDVAVCLAIHNAPVDKPNHSGDPACKWMKETDVPALENVLKILRHNSVTIIKAGGADLNYISLLAAQPPVFVAMGLSQQHAQDLVNAVTECDQQRLAEKKRREEERPAGGCPVMKSGRKKKGDNDSSSQIFSAADQSSTPTGHPPVDLTSVPSGSDPSNGQCPFFQKRAKQEAVSAAPIEAAAASASMVASPTELKATQPELKATQPAQVEHAMSVHTSPVPPTLNWAFFYEHRVVILLMLLSFFFGSYVERHLGALIHRLV